MLIKVTIHKEIVLSDIWLTDEQWDEMEEDVKLLSELFAEDVSAFLEECGGIEGLIQKVEVIPEETT